MSKTFNIEADIVVRKNMTNGSTSYFMRWAGEELLAVKNALVQAVCCKRAYIRGAFIAAGSMSDPSKSYHFEIVCGELAQAEYVRDMINSFDLDAKIVTRKKDICRILERRIPDCGCPEHYGSAHRPHGT